MAAWYQQFIPSYADLAEPLYQFKRKQVNFVCTLAAQEAYAKLKHALTIALVLAIPKEYEQYELYTDTSTVGLGAMLVQGGKATAYASRTLNSLKGNVWW